MTQSIALSATTLQNYQGTGVPEASLALILQRGGDELLLLSNDRSVACSCAQSAPKRNCKPTKISVALRL
jgi:hypothetical protein